MIGGTEALRAFAKFSDQDGSEPVETRQFAIKRLGKPVIGEWIYVN